MTRVKGECMLKCWLKMSSEMNVEKKFENEVQINVKMCTNVG